MRKRSKNYWIGKTIILILLMAKASATSYFVDNSKGWFFYESKPVESTPVRIPLIVAPKQQTAGEKAAIELEALQKQLKEASALALLYPTPDNVWNYQQIKTKVYNMSGVLTDQEMRNEWVRPDSYAANNPTGGEGLEINRSELNHCSEDMVRKTGDVWGMYLFTSKDCKYCKAQINVQKQVASRYGITSMVIGFDSIRPSNLGDLEFGPDNGISTKFQIKNEGNPVTVMFNVKTGKSQVLGYGYIPLDNLNERICHLYTKKLGDL